MFKATYTHRPFLESVPVSSLLNGDRELVYITPKSTIGNVTSLMKEKNILSVPIWDEEKNIWVGSIDMFSIMTYVAFGRCTQGNENENENTLFSKIHYTDQEVGPLRLVTRSTQRMMVFPDEENLLNILQILTYSAHRIFIHPKDLKDKKEIKLFSQTDAVRFLCKNLDKLGEITNQFVEELGLVDELPITMSATESALQGFRTIRLMAVNAVGVVDENGQLIANLSASDVRGLSSEDLIQVKKPVLEFLKSRNPENKLSHPVTCNPRSLLKDVILQLVTAKIHRVWVVNSSNKPVGVITLSDICRTFAFN